MTNIAQRAREIDWRKTLATYAILTVGGLILASNVALFLAPSKIAPGGVSGAAIILNHFINFPVGVMMLIMNLPLLALGFQNLGPFHFLTKTLNVFFLSNPLAH